MLAQAVETIPGASALPGGSVYEPKWDGWRLTATVGEDRATLWSRRGTDLTARFPEVAAAVAAHVPAGTVLDGEVVVWVDDRLDFEQLQRRIITSPTRSPAWRARVRRPTSRSTSWPTPGPTYAADRSSSDAKSWRTSPRRGARR